MSKAVENSGLAPLPSEGRRAPRQRTLKAGKIVSLNKASIFDCQLRNLSRTGALLIMPSTTGVPKDFYLKLPGQRALVRCRIVRRTNTHIGVEFIRNSSDPDAR